MATQNRKTILFERRECEIPLALNRDGIIELFRVFHQGRVCNAVKARNTRRNRKILRTAGAKING